MSKEPNKSTIIEVTDKQQRDTDLVQVHFFDGTYLLSGWSGNSMRTPGPYLLAKDVWWPNRTPLDSRGPVCGFAVNSCIHQ